MKKPSPPDPDLAEDVKIYTAVALLGLTMNVTGGKTYPPEVRRLAEQACEIGLAVARKLRDPI